MKGTLQKKAPCQSKGLRTPTFVVPPSGGNDRAADDQTRKAHPPTPPPPQLFPFPPEDLALYFSHGIPLAKIDARATGRTPRPPNAYWASVAQSTPFRLRRQTHIPAHGSLFRTQPHHWSNTGTDFPVLRATHRSNRLRFCESMGCLAKSLSCLGFRRRSEVARRPNRTTPWTNFAHVESGRQLVRSKSLASDVGPENSRRPAFSRHGQLHPSQSGEAWICGEMDAMAVFECRGLPEHRGCRTSDSSVAGISARRLRKRLGRHAHARKPEDLRTPTFVVPPSGGRDRAADDQTRKAHSPTPPAPHPPLLRSRLKAELQTGAPRKSKGVRTAMTP